MHSVTAAGHTARASGLAVEHFAVLPILILILAQMGTSGDNGALSLAASALTHDLGATTSEIQLANMVYPLMGGAFMIAGGLAALTGLITATISGSAAPDAGGSNLTLLAIAAAVIGGTALTGGSGTIIGALIGAFVISCLNNGLVLLGAQATQSNVFLGLAIVAAMILNVQVDAVRVRRKR